MTRGTPEVPPAVLPIRTTTSGASPGGGLHRRRPGPLADLLGHHRRRAVVAISAVLLLLATATAVVLARRASEGPVDTVREFYAALAAREAGAARALLAPSAVYGEDATLLTDGTLRNPGYTPPGNPRFRMMPAPTDRYQALDAEEVAAVQVDYELAGTPRQSEMLLGRGGAAGDRWLIRNPLVRLGVTGGVRDAILSFAGTPYPSTDRERVAFPGAYVVTLAEDPIFEADPVTAFADGGPGVELVPRVRAGTQQEIEGQVRRYLDACATSPEVNPARCPFPMLWLSLSQLRAAKVSRTIVRYPTLVIEKSAAVDHSLMVRTDMPGEIRVALRRSPTQKPFLAKTEVLEVSGQVTVVDGRIVFNPKF